MGGTLHPALGLLLVAGTTVDQTFLNNVISTKDGTTFESDYSAVGKI